MTPAPPPPIPPGAAWALARYGDFAENAKTLIAPPGELRAPLAPLPVAGLRLDDTILAHLDHVGLRRIGDIIDMPRAPLTNRFGPLLVERLDQALGFAEEPISPNRAHVCYHARLAFAEPIGRPEDVITALDHLLAKLCPMLRETDHGVRRLELVLYRVDDTTAKAVIGTSRPSRDAAHLAKLFRDKIDDLYLGFGIEVAALIATATDRIDAAQPDLTGSVSGGSNTNMQEDAAQLVDRLSSRFGPSNIARLQAEQSHLPERAEREVPLAKAPTKSEAWCADQPRPQARPLQLLVQPLPIDVMAPVPDGPPVMFRWRKRQHRVTGAEGPERIAPEWWRTEGHPLTPEVRDYYRIQDQDGRRYWVFREGLYKPDRPPAWYLHGFFA